MISSRIVFLAATEAKGPGMLQICGDYLNDVLEDLKLVRNLKMNRVTQVLTIQPNTYGPFDLPVGYLRPYDFFYPFPASLGSTQSGLTIFLNMITMEQMDSEFKSPSVTNYAYEYATDLSTQAQAASLAAGGNGVGQYFIYPQFSQPVQVTFRYMLNQPNIVSPETSSATPWFPLTDYLITATAARMMGTTGDSRQEEFFNRAEKMLQPYLIMEGDEQTAVHAIQLDPRHFHFQRGMKPVKTYPY